MQRWEDAWADLDDWKEKWPHSNRRRLAAAMLRLDCEDFHGSMDLFKQAGGVSGLLGQASVLTQQGDTENAMARLGEALEKDPDRPGSKVALAMLLVQGTEERGQGTAEDRQCNETDWRRANNLCRDAMDWGAESDAAALACRAQVALDRGHSRAAESLLREARECFPYGAYTSALASVLIGMHRIDDAVNTLKIDWARTGATVQRISSFTARCSPGATARPHSRHSDPRSSGDCSRERYHGRRACLRTRSARVFGRGGATTSQSACRPEYGR